MKVTVQLFARAKDLADAGSVAVELSAGATVGDLRRKLANAHPSLAKLLARSRLAVDNDFADDSAVLAENSDVAMIPPVSGGGT